MEQKRCVHLLFVRHTTLDRFADTRRLWYETPEEIAQAIEWGKEKARLLRLVRKVMKRRLTALERRCIEMHYFENLPFRQAAAQMGRQPSSVYRAVLRSLRKLRSAIEEDRRERRPRGRPRRSADRTETRDDWQGRRHDPAASQGRTRGQKRARKRA